MVPQLLQEGQAGIGLRDEAEIPHEVVVADAMEQDLPAWLVVARAEGRALRMLPEQAVDRLDPVDLQHERRVEGDLVQPVLDLRSRHRRHQIGPPERIDRRHDDVAGAPFAGHPDERCQGRISHVAAIPVVALADPYGPGVRGQAGGGQERRNGDVRLRRDRAASVHHIGHADEDRGVGMVQPLRMLQDCRGHRLQGVAQKGEVVGRDGHRELLDPDRDRVAVDVAERAEIGESDEGVARPQGMRGDRAPELRESLAGPLRAARCEAVEIDGRVQGARAGRADRRDPEIPLAGEAVQHAPDEGAVGAGALHRQSNRLHRLSPFRWRQRCSNPRRPEAGAESTEGVLQHAIPQRDAQARPASTRSCFS
jgi:hypothetical protein